MVFNNLSCMVLSSIMTKLWWFSTNEKALDIFQFRIMYSLIGKFMKCIFEKQILADQEFKFITDFIVCVF